MTETRSEGVLSRSVVGGIVLPVRSSEVDTAPVRTGERSAYYATLLRAAAATISVLDAEGRVVSSGGDSGPILGHDDLVDVQVRDLVHPEDLPIYDDMTLRVLATSGVEIDCQLRMRHADGHWEVIEATANNLLDDPVIQGVLVTTRNVSRRHRHDRLLADSAAALEAVASGQPLAEVCRLVRSLLVHQDASYESAPDEIDDLIDALDGDESPGGLQARGILILARSSHLAAAELRERAVVDGLTGLANRIGFTEALHDQLLTGTGPAAVLLFDLDRFKQVNDAYGHSVGDSVLVSVADALRRAVRGGDVAARFGGDEFAVLCRQLEGDDAQLAARRVGQRLALAVASAPPAGTGLRVAASIGVSVDRVNGQRWTDPESWIADADHAMYEAKRLGRSRVIVADHDTRRRAGHRRRVETGLRDALETGGLEVWFQPIVELPAREVTAGEALLRWRTVDGELHSPGDFLQVAEDAGLMAAISLQTLGPALEQAVRWPIAPGAAALSVSVNLSVTQLLADDLLEIVADHLERTGLDPTRLVIEITEHVLGADEDLVAARLNGLRSLGVRLALDDFGTGWSSLRLVRTMPFDLIKVDRTFTADVDVTAEGADFAARIVALARSMGRRVVAEGIERESQLEALAGMGCHFGQGWLFGAPQPAERFRAARVLGAASGPTAS
jgi:diguanylate cyclase (GGDEF)-like protein/PAS domain S-box-containing protein